jgi:2-desacetyl-2-hydroxyethyl bacteriochlorophyllide A dehydrogenase
MSTTTDAIWFEQAQSAVYAPVELPEPGPRDLVVRAEYSGVSMGTEIWYYSGRRTGDIRFPAVPGYQTVGIVQSAGAEAQGFAPGDRVFVSKGRISEKHPRNWFGAHMRTLVADYETAIKIEDGIDPREAVFSGMPAVSMRGFGYLKTAPGDKVVVIGQGMIGQMSAQLSKIHGLHVMATDRYSMRVETSARYSSHQAVAADEVDLVQWVKEQTDGAGADIVIDTTGVPSIFKQCVDLVRHRGQIVMQGWYPEPISVDFHLTHLKEPTVYFPCGFYKEAQLQALSWLKTGELKIEPLITHVFHPKDCQEAYQLMLHRPADTLNVLFDWEV